MIRKRNEYTKREPSKDAGKIYIICEGDINGTEKDYYEFFEGLSSNLKLIIIPSEDGKTDPLKLMEQAKKQLLEETRLYTLDYMQNDKVWFAIDTDTWEEQDKIRPLRDFCTAQNDIVKNWMNENLMMHGMLPKAIPVLKYGCTIIFMTLLQQKMM